jgi:hypothetical protein
LASLALALMADCRRNQVSVELLFHPLSTSWAISAQLTPFQ